MPLGFYQMAPVLMHPSYPHLISRSPWKAHAAPIKVTKYISIKVLLQLFAGTVIIFIVTVLFWKLGKFSRSLTRNKVLRKGNTTTTRYARTWYGWVSAKRHEQNKEIIRRCFKKIRNWAAWSSSNNDYRWAWWDPGQKELNAFRKGKRPLRWMPVWVKSYSYIAADTIWNPGPHLRHSHNTMPNIRRGSASLTAMTGALSASHTLAMVVWNCQFEGHKRRVTRATSQGRDISNDHAYTFQEAKLVIYIHHLAPLGLLLRARISQIVD
ncbi:hypothetical protein BO78DRAFT_416675 [Aspergillus sclerotiicarbonarius CBS 121057]|uniref:Uncharacterized protein n=1 Tax=Aspergillus sclerotiicarbonarius (strain CBS 121057 / IBT 28362) TaxID=1448318 RepID=A0A319EVQ7_ASPSB|nr:hypothetical protein BO78DRAFT_416675 [Aspergillus sclerotiicarbonarius CBS 121057]